MARRRSGGPDSRATSYRCWRAGGRSRIKKYRLAAAVVVALLAAVIAPAAGASGAKPAVIPAPKGLPAFYAVPTPIPAVKGKLIKAQKVAVAGLHGTMYRVMYSSLNLQNKYVAVTGVVAVPSGPPPTGGFPVVSWGHGTDGMADVCAPSLEPGNSAPLANALLDKGWLVTATDYQGEGTPGLHPYIAGTNSAHNAIDIVRTELGGWRSQAAVRRAMWFPNWQPPKLSGDPQPYLEKVRTNLEAWLRDPEQAQLRNVLRELQSALNEKAADPAAGLALIARLPIFAEKLLGLPAPASR